MNKRIKVADTRGSLVFADEGKGTANTSPLAFRFPPDLEAHILAQPNRQDWVRQAVREKMERDGFK